MIQIILKEDGSRESINLLPSSALLRPMPLSPTLSAMSTGPPTPPLILLTTLCQETLRLDGRKTLIPKDQRNSNVWSQTFRECLYALSLLMYLPIQADWQANDEYLRLSLLNNALDRAPDLLLVAREMQRGIWRSQEACSITHSYTNPGFTNI